MLCSTRFLSAVFGLINVIVKRHLSRFTVNNFEVIEVKGEKIVMGEKKLEEFKIDDILEELSQRRPIFHNERDLQFEISWLIKEEYDCQIRHEYYCPTDDAGKRSYIDFVAYTDDYCIAFELKYKTKFFQGKIKGEQYDLKDQSAQDFGCAYVLSDLSRTEKLIGKEVNGKVINKGFIVFLTNDDKYKKGFKEDSLFGNFSLTDGRKINGKIEFVKKTSTTEKFDGIEFTYNNTYEVEWIDYSNGEKDKINSAVFKLVFEVK